MESQLARMSAQATRLTVQEHIGYETDPKLLSENTTESHHTCFQLCVLVDEMMFTALPTTPVTS